jgi:hypothetical protein
MVYVLTFGKPSGARRSARCKVFNDHVAVSSRSRSGGRRNSARIRSRSSGPYCVARARVTDKAGALWLRANCSSARRSGLVNRRSGCFWRLTALPGQCIETAPEVYRILRRDGKPGVK